MASCSFRGPSRKYDLDTVVSMLFESDSSNFSEDDDIDFSDMLVMKNRVMSGT